MHFTVLVVGEDVQSQLAPFQENNDGDCPREYMTFYDVEDKYREEYENKSNLMVVLEDGQLVSPHDKIFTEPDESGHVGVPEHFRMREVLHKSRYETLDAYVLDHYGEERDAETGRYGTWDNPNSKWDWWLLGGRWTGFFKLKAGEQGATGRPGILTEPAQQGRCDSALKQAVDFEGMQADARKEAEEAFDRYEAIVKTHGHVADFDEFKKTFNGNFAQARGAYDSQPTVQTLREARLMPFGNLSEVYGVSREKFSTRAANNAVTAHAVLMDGKWYEQGDMGWWGAVAEDDDIWSAEIIKLIDSLPNDTLLSIVDCHS